MVGNSSLRNKTKGVGIDYLTPTHTYTDTHTHTPTHTRALCEYIHNYVQILVCVVKILTEWFVLLLRIPEVATSDLCQATGFVSSF